MYSTYSLLILVCGILASPYLAYQAIRYKKYIGSLGQRMGYLPVSFNLDGEESIWIHAVSVGETLTARALAAAGVFASVIAVTSPDLLYRGLRTARPYLEELVTADEEDVPIVSVLDGHSHALAFLGSALGVPQIPLGVDDFGQSGARGDLYRHYGIDANAIAAAARTLLGG